LTVGGAWEAALRGYKVALVEKIDFGSGVSAKVHKGARDCSAAIRAGTNTYNRAS
jgi:hypothetical protein